MAGELCSFSRPSSAAPVRMSSANVRRMTEAEVVDALRRSLPVDSTQSMRKRTRAGMGGCQGKL